MHDSTGAYPEKAIAENAGSQSRRRTNLIERRADHLPAGISRILIG